MYAGLYVSLAASFLALICCLGAVAGHGSTGASEPTFPWRMRVLAIALPLASIELTALLVWLVGFQGTVEWRWG